MIKNKTALFNQVLTRIGESRITDADSTNDSAVTIRDEYPQALDQILAEYPWICATRRAALAQKAGANLTRYGYMFQLPADCITVQALIDGESLGEVPDEYMREGDTLYCNNGNPIIKYTKRIEFYDMDTAMVEAFVLLLAHKVAWRITQSVDIETDMYQRYMVALNTAESLDGEERARQQNRVDFGTGDWGRD